MSPSTPSSSPQSDGAQRGGAAHARWARVQAISGLVFLGFAAVHLVNTALGALGADAYNGFQRAVRSVYQYPALEIGLVLVPLLVHAAAGIARMRLRRQHRGGRPVRASSPRLRAHRYAGYFLLAAMLGHISATRLPALLEGAHPEFEGVAFTFQFMPAFFYPYYALLALAGVVHACLGAPTALAVLGMRGPARSLQGTWRWAPIGVIATVVLLGVAGMGGLLYPIPDLSEHPFARFVLATVARVASAP